MIIDKGINMICRRGNTKNLKFIFGSVLEMGKEYFIPIEKLSTNSHHEILVKCDFCDYIRKIPYRQYLENIKKDGKYYCSKCSPLKVKNTCLEKYNVDNVFKTDKSKNKIRELYGCVNVFQNEKIKQKSKNTKLKKYGDGNYINIEKYKRTILKKYGVDNISKILSVKQKKINTSLKNWGVEYPIQNKEVVDKMIETINKNRTYDLSDYKVYRYKSILLLNKNRKKLIEDWNGYDYYDGEYIADNFNLKQTDRNYPTIDHKISVFYAYINKLSVEEVSLIDNLCMTKKYINSKKNRKNEDAFKILFSSTAYPTTIL